MDTSQLIALFDQDQRFNVQYPDMRREVLPQVVRHVNTSGYGEGMVIYSRMDEASAAGSIAEQIDYFTAIGQNFEWKVYDYDWPPDLKERLRAKGFIIGEAEEVMLLDILEAPPTLLRPPSQDVRRIVDPAKLADVILVESQVWQEDYSGLGHYLGEALNNYPERMSVYVAYAGELPVSAAWVYFPQGSSFASLWGGSTVSGFRRQGLYTALLATRLQEALGRGVRFLTVDASPMSQPILEKHGFVRIATSYPCKWAVNG